MKALSNTGLALGVLALGYWISGGAITTLLQPVQAAMVIGGSLLVVVAAYSWNELTRAYTLASRSSPGGASLVKMKELIELAQIIRKEGVLALEGRSAKTRDPILKLGLKYVAEGASAETVKPVLLTLRQEAQASRVRAHELLEFGASVAPTLGIMAAVLGLIQVMGQLSTPALLGAGVARAFVSTFYGLAFSNLFFLPLATRVKSEEETLKRELEMSYVGVISMLEGVSPQILGDRLQAIAGGSR